MQLSAVKMYMPPIRPLERRNSYEVDLRLMAKGQRLFAKCSTPMRPFPDTLKAAENLRAVILLEDEQYALRRQLILMQMRQFKESKVKDKPRIPPFKGDCIKKALLTFKRWRAKRAQRRYEDWVNHRETIPSIIVHR